MVIGITGSSGAGKSTVCDILEEKYHIKVINADEIAKQLSQKGTKYLEEIVEQFGKEVLLENGELNRQRLANIIYAQEEKRRQLNQCTLKYIKQKIVQEIQENQKNVIAIDAPLLFEADLDKICDITIAVVSQNKKMQLQRIMERDNIEETHAIARISAQQSNEFYIEKCNYTIMNDDGIHGLEEQVRDIFKDIF